MARRIFAYWPRVVGWAQGVGLARADAQDVAARVMIAALRSAHRHGEPQAIAPWIFVAALRSAKAFHRRERRAGRAAHPTPPERLHRVPSPEPPADEILAASPEPADITLERIAAEIRPELWAIFRAHEIDGEPVASIAAAAGIPVSTAYNRLRLARRELGAAVKRLRAAHAHQERATALRATHRRRNR